LLENFQDDRCDEHCRIDMDEACRRQDHKGLQSLEDIVGDNGLALKNGGIKPSMADAVLVPQLLFHTKFTHDMNLESKFPRLAKILERCLCHPWFSKTHPSIYARK
jgi:glutathione S-transferase